MYYLILALSLSIVVHTQTTSVEQVFIQESGRKALYDQEKIPVVEVNNSFKLGKLVALRFLEWVIANPEGVISLPTGKTPEYFIKYLEHYKKNWLTPAVQQELQRHGITAASFPDTSRLTFVQMDEFFPMRSAQKNSFNFYIKKFYLPLLNLRPENIILIDTAAHEDVAAYCTAYEEKIKALGGIGFFLGGIGPDGHIAFNMRGSERNSTTRLITLNYESAAAAATDLGGIEFSRNKKAVTIGLQTIAARPDATIIIMAAGEAKAPVVAQSIEGDELPAAAFHGHHGTRFYLTKGAACHLRERIREDFSRASFEYPEQFDAIVHGLALGLKKTITDLSLHDFEDDALGAVVLQKLHTPLPAFLQDVRQRLVEKIERGLHDPQNCSVLHTEPHHDDIMLSYHPVATRMLPHNNNFFVTLTSGFNAVTNGYMRGLLESCDEDFVRSHYKEIFENPYEQLAEGTSTNATEPLILLHQLRTIFSLTTEEALLAKISWLRNDYLHAIQPGEKDIPEIQLLKGAMRESEIDRLWARYHISHDRVHHLRSQFYTGDYFSPNPTITNDVLPIVALLKKTQPHLVTVALDPEGTGPDTHYKVLQLVAEALRLEKNLNPTIWGYRNVWFRFKPHEATRMTPVSAEELERLHTDFMDCFSTQKSASFPAHQFDGPFSGLSCAIVREQLEQLKHLLGKEYFEQHLQETMRTAHGMLFLKEMTLEEFLSQATELKARVDFNS